MSSSSDRDSTTAHPFDKLRPETVLEAAEVAGLVTDGRLLALNSYENRVWQIGLDDALPVIGKFYRPGRWSNEAILEEHAFAAELAGAGLSVGYVVWLARGGMLLASLLSSMPAWRAIDPLPVLANFRDDDEDDDDESLDSLVKKGGAGKAAKPAQEPASADPDVPLDDGATT